jgi:hypothetical protein
LKYLGDALIRPLDSARAWGVSLDPHGLKVPTELCDDVLRNVAVVDIGELDGVLVPGSPLALAAHAAQRLAPAPFYWALPPPPAVLADG